MSNPVASNPLEVRYMVPSTYLSNAERHRNRVFKGMEDLGSNQQTDIKRPYEESFSEFGNCNAVLLSRITGELNRTFGVLI